MLDYQPSTGFPSAFDNDLLDPMSTSAGVFGGVVLALQFNVDLSAAGVLRGTTNYNFASLSVCGLTATPSFNARSVANILIEMNNAIGGAPPPYPYDVLATLAGGLSQVLRKWIA